MHNVSNQFQPVSSDAWDSDGPGVAATRGVR